MTRLEPLEKRFAHFLELAEEYKELRILERTYFEDEVIKLEKKLKSSAHSVQDEELLASQVSSLDKQEGVLDKEIAQREQILKEMSKELEISKQEEKENTPLPKERYLVNLYRDISRVKYHANPGPNELKGFICTESGQVKTFCFDKLKQSEFFIANSLWAMGDEENW
ncbi:kinetochore protein Spc24 [Biomphalaria pfeifferi]|uniref:Kinetochore protein Spc24 n=1 Tax=Biomphalaria pfeifferi TaxID=112525 RepID=A0AAD8F963_BIOPF|nr:kinetochore protein Spc24 [Biomphalaria pfeifferi]